MMRVFGAALCCAFLLFVPSASAAGSGASPGCESSFAARADWASDYEEQLARVGASGDDAAEMMRTFYTALELCSGEVVWQSGDAVRGPKPSGQAPPSTFEPTGRTRTFRKRVGRSGRMLTCSNIAFDPQFSGGTVRTGGRSSCSGSATLSATVCQGKYFHSTGYTGQYHCNGGSVWGSVITVYTGWTSCNGTTSYRTNYYGHTGNAFSLYFNGAVFC